MTITIEDFKVPESCGQCKFVRGYTEGPYRRNPHYCCEFMWFLKEIDYKVNLDLIDENCPLKVVNNMKDIIDHEEQ